MNTLRNITKKAIAVGSGAVMLGATIGAAMALDLATYPAPFIKNGQFDGMIVVGEKAQTSDVIGSIDIAASLQRAATTPVDGGSGTTTVVTGDNVKIGRNGKMLEIGRYIGAVTNALTESDLQLLKSGTVNTNKATTDYTQTLTLNVAATGNNGKVVLDQNDDDVSDMYLEFLNGEKVFTYELEFTSGFQSKYTSGAKADDWDKEDIFMLGQYYNVVDSTVTTGVGSAASVTLDLISGALTDTISQGQTKTYTVNGKKYEVTALIISNTGTGSVKFLINGETTKSLGIGDTTTLSDGIDIGIREVLTTGKESVADIAEFYLGANKISITDADTTVTGNGKVEINRNSQPDLVADLKGTQDGSNVRLDAIDITLSANAKKGSDVFLGKGMGLRSAIRKPEAMLANWDIVFQGVTKPTTSKIEFTPRGDTKYDLTFTNRLGTVYTVPYAYGGTTGAGSNDAVTGNDRNRFITYEGDGATMDLTGFPTQLNDYFAITDSDGAAATDTDNTYVYRFTDVDTSQKTITLEDIGSGQEKTVPYTGTPTNVAAATGTINAGGKSFDFALALSDGATTWTGISTGYKLAVDLDHSTTIGDVPDSIALVTQGGGILVPYNKVAGAIGNGAHTWKATLGTQSDKLDSQATQNVSITFTETLDKLEVDMPAQVAGTYYETTTADGNWDYGVDAYGTWFAKTVDTGSNRADDLTITYPAQQVEALVYVTGANAQASTATAGGATRVNPIAVGSAVLDKDVTYDQTNMIVVGGPCVNTIAAQLLNNPTVCSEGFVAGQATLKLFDTGSNTALLVAGMNAQDTVGASRVLAEYQDYALSGASKTVVVTSLTDLKVQ